MCSKSVEFYESYGETHLGVFSVFMPHSVVARDASDCTNPIGDHSAPSTNPYQRIDRKYSHQSVPRSNARAAGATNKAISGASVRFTCVRFYPV